MDRSFDFVTLLKNHENKYKHKPTSITNVSTGIQKRLEKNMKYRKSSRLSVFDSIRNLQSNEVVITDQLTEKQKKIEYRKLQLEKWKEEKEKKKKQAASQKKKPFVTGISHPSLRYVPPPPPPRPMPSKSGRVTRSQTRVNTENSLNIAKSTTSKAKSFAPINAVFNPELKITGNIPNIAKKLESKRITLAFEPKESKPPQSKCKSKEYLCNEKNSSKPKEVKKSKSPKSQSNEDFSHKVQDKNKTPRKSTKANSMVTPKDKIPKSESSSEERLRSPKSPAQTVNNLVNLPMTPEQIAAEVKKISPHVTMSRGKDKARKEIMLKMAEGLLDDDSGNTENVEYFRRQLDSEVLRITKMCDTWDKISQQIQLSVSVQELVLSAVGQARLLVSQKLTQFGLLVSACARPEPGAALVTPTDLHGFWDMVFMQIENVDMRFKKLEDIRARNWQEEVPVVQKKRTQKLVKNTVKPAATSHLQEFLLDARKKKNAQKLSGMEPDKDAVVDSKTFHAGFFSVSSPVKFPATPPAPVANATPPGAGSERSLLKAVLSSEAKKVSENSASLAMMRASIISRNIETESTDVSSQHETGASTPVTVSGTPAKSILKSANKASNKKNTSKKSIKVVLFDNTYGDTEESEEDSALIKDGTQTHDANVQEDSNKENKTSRAKIQKQNTLDDRSSVLTRSRRKSLGTLLDMSKDGAQTHDANVQEDSNKENKTSRAKIQKQNTLDDRSPVLTRSRRKSLGTLLDMSIGMLEEQLKDAATTSQTPRRSRKKSNNCAADD